MREIKFRAFDKEKGMLHYDGIFNSPNFFDNSNLMQYTGLKDKNGKEIYEGDVIKFKDKKGRGEKGTYEVIFKDGCYGYLKNNKWGDLSLWIDAIWTPSQKPENFIEIIGNIYENKF